MVTGGGEGDGLTSGVSLIFLGLEYWRHKGGSLLHSLGKLLHPSYTKAATKAADTPSQFQCKLDHKHW